MKFKIMLLSEVDNHEQRAMFTRQIAKCYQNEWGKYRADLTEADWIKNTFASAQTEQKFIALNEEGKLVGTVTLKKENMENKYPGLGPWLSGLVVPEEFRNKKISAVLMIKLLLAAQAQGSDAVYLFTHVLNLESYYKKLGWNLITMPGDEHPTYQNNRILLFKGEPKVLIPLLLAYLNTKNINYDLQANVCYLTDPPSVSKSSANEVSPR